MIEEGLKIVFMGTPEFAVASLKAIHEGQHEVVGVVTAPDRKKGRGLKVIPSAVKRYAADNNLKLLQPEKLRQEDFLAELDALQADLFVVVAFRMLPEVVWTMPKFGTINLHASLLPQYRGAAPINWAIINGEKESGVTTFFINNKIDKGELLEQRKVPIDPKENAGQLHDKLMSAGAALLLNTIDKIANGKAKPIPQVDTGNLHLAPKIFKEDCQLDWQNSVNTIYNKIRGLSPYPTAWTKIVHKEHNETLLLKVYDASIDTDNTLKPSEINSDGKTYIKIGCGKGNNLILNKVQLQGKKIMMVRDLLNGFDINNYTIAENETF